MLIQRRGLFFKTGDDEGGSGGGGAGAGDERKAEKKAVDQLHNHEDRLNALEGGFFERIATALKPAPAATGTATPGVKNPPPVKKPKTVIDELGECMDPFDLFADPQPPPQAEAPATDEAAA